MMMNLGTLKLAAALLAFPLGVAVGWWEMKQRHDAFVEAVAATGRAQEEISRRIAGERVRINLEVKRDHERQVSRLAADNRTLLDGMRAHARRSVLPPVAPPGGVDKAGSGGDAGQLCFGRDELDAQLQRAMGEFLEGAAPVLQRGDRALLGLAACVEWADRQDRLTPPGEAGG